MTVSRISIKKLALALLGCVMSATALASDNNVGFVYVSPIGDAG